jgi:hypothetical protein
MAAGTCSTFSSCTNVATSNCASTSGCASAQTASGTVCATTQEAAQLNEAFKKASGTGNTFGTDLRSILPTVLPGILNIIQTLITGKAAQTTSSTQVSVGIPASTTPVVQAGTTAPASLSLATLAPLLSQFGVRTANPSTCDTVTDPAACDTQYPKCGWLSETCKSLTGLTSKEICTGVGINDSGELIAKERCTQYNQHCTLSSDNVACIAKE